jgi:hypothetical protein
MNSNRVPIEIREKAEHYASTLLKMLDKNRVYLKDQESKNIVAVLINLNKNGKPEVKEFAVKDINDSNKHAEMVLLGNNPEIGLERITC